MPKRADRSFLDRALEALAERYPEQKPTQTRLAKIAGVKQPSVNEWRQPGRAPKHETVLRIAYALNVCVEWLYTERGPKRPPQTHESERILQDWQQLDPESKRQLMRYAEFLRGSSTRQ